MRAGTKIVALSLLVVVTVAMRVNNLVKVKDKTMTLDEAVKGKFVSLELKGLGGHSGNCVSVKVKNLKGEKLILTYPAGTMFKPGDDGCQNILMPQDQIFVIYPGQNIGTPIRGFCCEASDRSPSKDMNFTLASNTDAKMKQLYAFMKGKKYTDDVLQEAIWCVSNGHNVSSICDDNDESLKALRAELCKITGQKDTWYDTPVEHTVDEEGNISHETIAVSGDIKFKATKNGKVHNEIWDANNKLVIKNPNTFNIIPGNIEYGFDIKVKGWEKGTYFVKVFEDDKVIHSQEFKI